MLIAFVALKIFTSSAKALVALAGALFCFFFFGSIHEFFKSIAGGTVFASYRFILPLLLVSVVAGGVYLHRTRIHPARFAKFLSTLVAILLLVEIVHFSYIVFTDKKHQFGDTNHEMIERIAVPDSVAGPDIVWIVMDEYSGGTGLKNGWQFQNPLHDSLRQRGFFVADSAVSPYNYTHYSLVSTLDMMYLDNLRDHSIIHFSDIVRGHRSIYETNTTRFLKDQGYSIHNYTIYDVEDHPTLGEEKFENGDFRLIHDQTLPARVNQDIGWNFRNLLAADRKSADSVDAATAMLNEATYRLSLFASGKEAAKKASQNGRPDLLMIHSMLTHEPFLYLENGEIDPASDFGMHRDRYIPAIKYANNHIISFMDSILKSYQGKNVAIILQGDHGYKFDESDPLFEKESCSILYAVYYPDGNYAALNNKFNSVNTFRVLFNKYFNTTFPVLGSRSHNLYYR